MARKKGGGGKLNRSEIIQARLDPKLHMAAEIMARGERRTLSSFIERCIEQAAKVHKVRRNLFIPWWTQDPDLYCADKIYSESDMVPVERAVQDIGADHEALRFFKFASYFPDLLNKNEEEMFNKITFTPYFWMHYPVNMEDQKGNIIRKLWVPVNVFEGLVREHLFEYWERIKSNQINLEDLGELPAGSKIPAPLKEDPRAIRKYLKRDDSNGYIIIYAWDENNSIKVSEEDAFWRRYAKNLQTKKIEIKKTEDGPQIITTLVPPTNKSEQKAWLEFYKKEKEKINDGN